MIGLQTLLMSTAGSICMWVLLRCGILISNRLCSDLCAHVQLNWRTRIVIGSTATWRTRIFFGKGEERFEEPRKRRT